MLINIGTKDTPLIVKPEEVGTISVSDFNVTIWVGNQPHHIHHNDPDMHALGIMKQVNNAYESGDRYDKVD